MDQIIFGIIIGAIVGAVIVKILLERLMIHWFPFKETCENHDDRKAKKEGK